MPPDGLSGGATASTRLIDTPSFDLTNLAAGTLFDINVITTLNGSFISGAQQHLSCNAGRSATTEHGAILGDSLIQLGLTGILVTRFGTSATLQLITDRPYTSASCSCPPTPQLWRFFRPGFLRS